MKKTNNKNLPNLTHWDTDNKITVFIRREFWKLAENVISEKLINIKMTFDNLWNEISELVPSYIPSLVVIPHNKNVMLKMYPFPKKLLKIPPVLLCLMLGLNITWTEKPSKRQKILFQTIIYDAELSENYLSLRWRLYENLKPKSSMPLPSDSVALVEKLKKSTYSATFCWMVLKQLYLHWPLNFMDGEW